MILREILRSKGNVVHTTTPQATLQEVVQKLVRHNCGSLVICEREGREPGRMLGIVTERDILRACAVHQCPLEDVRVASVMTIDVITASPNDTVEDTMGLMTDRRIRHLPIVEEDRLEGLVSIGDIVKAQHDQLSLENHYLKSYLHG